MVLLSVWQLIYSTGAGNFQIAHGILFGRNAVSLSGHPMIAEIISIGDELTSGQRLDTNSQWLAQQLGDLGVQTIYHTTVADDFAANVAVFSAAVDRADLVVATGGLGPTADDLTRDAIANVAAVKLTLHEPSLEHIRGLFTRHNRPMPERNAVQAMFPAGSHPIFNPSGTAPGIDMLVASAKDDHFARIFALPGVPAEMQEMFIQSVAPAILQMQPSPCVIRHHRIKCFGAGESQIEAMLPDLIARGRQPTVGITVHAATITLRITASGRTPEECYAAMQPTVATIYQCLGDLVFGEEEDELEDAVIRLLVERNASLATVEFGTRGLLAHWLSQAASGKSTFVVSQVFNNPPEFTSEQKRRADVSEAFNLASREYAEDLAFRFRERTGCDYCLAIGEFPGAEASLASAAPPYHFALATPDQTVVMSSSFVSHPSIWKPRVAKQALNLLRMHLLKASQR
jgi:nicotinamide-nucleotide amidase